VYISTELGMNMSVLGPLIKMQVQLVRKNLLLVSIWGKDL
jgi:hypothetical protein